MKFAITHPILDPIFIKGVLLQNRVENRVIFHPIFHPILAQQKPRIHPSIWI
jgi:hypothetical protein